MLIHEILTWFWFAKYVPRPPVENWIVFFTLSKLVASFASGTSSKCLNDGRLMTRIIWVRVDNRIFKKSKGTMSPTYYAGHSPLYKLWGTLKCDVSFLGISLSLHGHRQLVSDKHKHKQYIFNLKTCFKYFIWSENKSK